MTAQKVNNKLFCVCEMGECSLCDLQSEDGFIDLLHLSLLLDMKNGSSMSNGITNSTPCQIKAPLVVTIVGLGCRGKSLAAHKISRNLIWKGEDVKGEC